MRWSASYGDGWVRHMRGSGGRSLRIAVAAFGLAIGLFNPGQWLIAEPNRAAAQTNDAEKQAFAAAKDLGTVEAWDAFLSNYPAGFYADLARAYVKKLAGEPGAPQASEPSASDSGRPCWCASPNNATERTICDDADLSRLDSVLNVAYRRAKHDSPHALTDIEYVQKHWLLGQRNLCGTDAACLSKRYNEQIQILESFFAN